MGYDTVNAVGNGFTSQGLMSLPNVGRQLLSSSSYVVGDASSTAQCNVAKFWRPKLKKNMSFLKFSRTYPMTRDL